MNNFMLNLIIDTAYSNDTELDKLFPAIFNIYNWHKPLDESITKLESISIET